MMKSKPVTYALYVNLSASQVRKRLKGRGFGVRDIQASDRNQAVIVHTATGDHLRQLIGLFDDVASSTRQADLATPLENLHSLGPTSAAWLREIGIYSLAELKRTGAVLAFHLIKQRHARASLNLLWGLAAAVADKKVTELTESEKANLRAAVEVPS